MISQIDTKNTQCFINTLDAFLNMSYKLKQRFKLVMDPGVSTCPVKCLSQLTLTAQVSPEAIRRKKKNQYSFSQVFCTSQKCSSSSMCRNADVDRSNMQLPIPLQALKTKCLSDFLASYSTVRNCTLTVTQDHLFSSH